MGVYLKGGSVEAMWLRMECVASTGRERSAAEQKKTTVRRLTQKCVFTIYTTEEASTVCINTFSMHPSNIAVEV